MFLQEGDFEQATRLGEQLIRMRYSGGYEILARSFTATGKAEQALIVLQRAVGESPELWSLWAELATAHSNLGQISEAFRALAQARRLPHSDRDALDFNEGVLLFRQNRPGKAMELLEGVLERCQEKETRLAALTQLLKILAVQGRLMEALVMLGEAQLHDHDNAEILTLLAETVLQAGEPIEAAKLAQQAQSIRSSDRAQAIIDEVTS